VGAASLIIVTTIIIIQKGEVPHPRHPMRTFIGTVWLDDALGCATISEDHAGLFKRAFRARAAGHHSTIQCPVIDAMQRSTPVNVPRPQKSAVTTTMLPPAPNKRHCQSQSLAKSLAA